MTIFSGSPASSTTQRPGQHASAHLASRNDGGHGMNATAWWAGWSIIVIISLSTPTQAQEKIDRQSESHQAILNYLGSLKSVRLGKRVQLQPLGDDDLQTVFNQCEFFLLRYPRYPSEVIPVEPLRPNN